MSKSKIEKRLPEPQHSKEQNSDTTSVRPAIAKPNVICCQSVYATFEHSKIDFPKEISRWKNVIEFNKEGTINYLENKERSISIINVAEVNLQYLLSLFPDFVPS